MLEFSNGNEEYKFAPESFDSSFKILYLATLKEAEKLSKALKYPNLSKEISKMDGLQKM